MLINLLLEQISDAKSRLALDDKLAAADYTLKNKYFVDKYENDPRGGLLFWQARSICLRRPPLFCPKL
jgi:hypothetical protein